jgi:hypothetical protein
MKKMLIVLVMAGLLLAGAVSAVQDVDEQVQDHFDVPHNAADTDESTPDGGGGGSGSGVPG